MYLFWWFLLSCVCVCFINHLDYKLISLLCIECLMLLALGAFYSLGSFSFSTLFIPILFTILMVLDSVYSVSMLISGSRSGAPNSSLTSSF